LREIDLELYLVTDRRLTNDRSLKEIIEKSVEGGVSVVQLREKNCSYDEFLKIAFEVKKILKPLNIPLIINDNIDIALAVNAEGLHIGQGDISYKKAREILGNDVIIGLSVESVEDAIEAENLDVDYLGISPVFSTPTKTDIFHQLGLEGIRKIRKISKHKLVAIGGINKENTEAIINAGADGIAVVSAICSAPNPKFASQELKLKIISAKEGKR